MIYPNGLLMARIVKQSSKADSRVLAYTKHYYVGSERVSARTGYIANLGLYVSQPYLTASGMGTLRDYLWPVTTRGPALNWHDHVKNRNSQMPRSLR